MIILQYQLTVHTKLLYVFRNGFRTAARAIFRSSGVFKFLVMWHHFLIHNAYLSFVLFMVIIMLSEQMSDGRDLLVRFETLNFNVHPAISSIVKANTFCSV